MIGLSDDIARSMSALSARVSTVPGRSVIGIELPNAHREKVVLREILSARDFGDSNMRLPLALGKDIGGGPVVANLAKMPHLLIAGTTGSGKSVAINTMILSLLYKLTPEECRLIMIDPKMLELSVYDGIPHLLSPVVTDPKKAVVALKWTVREMEERYKRMAELGVRSIDAFNKEVNRMMEEEMVKLGLFSMEEVKDQDPNKPLYMKYFMHGTSHPLGLDVHDVGSKYDPLEAGMVLTCEPGIYIREESIGIRIEDDILVTQDGCRSLTNQPRELSQLLPEDHI